MHIYMCVTKKKKELKQSQPWKKRLEIYLLFRNLKPTTGILSTLRF